MTIHVLREAFLIGTVILSVMHLSRSNEYDDSTVEYRIVGGRPANIALFPYQISLQRWNGIVYFPYCGGTIISPRYVVTAAHCLYLLNKENKTKLVDPKSLRVIAGTNDSFNENLEGQERFIAAVFPHHKFIVDTAFDDDIGLLKLSSDFNATSLVQPMHMRTEEPETNEMCTVSGWGTKKANGPTSRYLLEINVPIVNYDNCKKIYGVKLSKNMICAGFKYGGRDSCQGDSGGPLVCRGKLTGIVSFGHGCASPFYPGVYTNVAHYQEWIRDVSSRHSASSVGRMGECSIYYVCGIVFLVIKVSS